MNPKRVYIDTSVVGGCFDPEFRTASLALFFQFRTGRMIALLSDVLDLEPERAPAAVSAVLDHVGEHREHVRVTYEMRRLAERYIRAGVIGRANVTDAVHVAAATACRADMLVTWDRRHIAHPIRIHGYNAVNADEGHPSLAIHTPEEIRHE
jgi:hypothetical protein